MKAFARSEKIEGTQTARAKHLPVEKREAGPKGYGEGTITYTLPPKDTTCDHEEDTASEQRWRKKQRGQALDKGQE